MPASMLVYLPSGLLICVFHATPEQFRIGRFLENVFYFQIFGLGFSAPDPNFPGGIQPTAPIHREVSAWRAIHVGLIILILSIT
jgi:hypothetical protein